MTAPRIIRDIRTFMDTTGHAPSAEEVREIANFREPGGIGRLTEGLAWTADRIAANARRRGAA